MNGRKWSEAEESVVRRFYDTLSAKAIASILPHRDRKSVSAKASRMGVSGDPPPDDLRERFWDKVDRSTPDGCWEWVGARSFEEYGRIKVNGKFYRAHRVSLLLANRPPSDPLALHHCDNPPCVRPNHLYWGTHSENMRDAYERGDHGGCRGGEDHPSSKLSSLQVGEVRSLYQSSDWSQAEVGAAFAISQGHTSRIINRDTRTEW